MTPAQRLSRSLRTLRGRYLARRAVEILAIALALDLLTNLASGILFLALEIPIPTQFFLQALVLILVAQSVWRSREKAFAVLLDRTFDLKDRVLCHVEYRKDPSVTQALREAQAMESLRSLDMAAIGRRFGPRFPRSLLLTVPLFTGLTLFYMDLPYTPPSPIGRTVVNMLSHDPADIPSPASNPAEAAAGPGADHGAQAVTVRTAGDPMGTNVATAAPPEPQGPVPDAGDGKGMAGPERRGASNEAPAGGTGPIQSFPVTDEVSPIVPPVLADETSMPDLLDPKRLLGLIPWPEGDEAGPDVTRLARDVPTPSPDGYPVAYRAHIDRYFKELLAWQTP